MQEPLVENIEKVETQQAFDEYISILPPKAQCKYMISTVVNLCDCKDINCPFRGNEVYSFAHGPKKECKRPQIMHMKELLGVKDNKPSEIV